jgi:hypothetical protein
MSVIIIDNWKLKIICKIKSMKAIIISILKVTIQVFISFISTPYSDVNVLCFERYV